VRVLLTGVSSFTGLWFARALRAAGCEVVAPLQTAAYGDPLRHVRIEEAARVAEIVPATPFGSDAFLRLLERGFDVLCHHGEKTANPRSLEFDVQRAVAAATFNAAATLETAWRGGVKRLVFTGSVFEEGEGRGTEPLVAFGPYGLFRTLATRALKVEADNARLEMVKFVAPHPFGPYEVQTLQRQAMTRWRDGQPVRISHPFYGRDHAPVDLLAKVYARAATGALGAHVAPSVYPDRSGDFFERMAAEVRARTGWVCGLVLAESQQPGEPLERYNLERVRPADYGWSESGFWDAYAAYYAGGG
jgi:nucleoside-diphosphate-sugar epimerase